MVQKFVIRKITCIINALAIIWLCGCATQGRTTSLTFDRSDSFKSLDSSMEKLKNQYDGSLQQQISALRALRFISKYNTDPGKQEIALRGLTFFAFVSDDGDIRDRSRSRLKTVLESKDWEINLKFTVIDSLIDIVTGELGFNEEHDGLVMNFGVSSGIREDVLKFLLKEFESLDSEIQYYTVTGFHRFLFNPPTLGNCPENICDEDVKKNQEDWNLGKEVKNIIPSNADPSAVEAGVYGAATKRVILDERKEWNEENDELKEILWDWIEDRLEDLDTDFLVQGRLIRFAGEIENFSLQENIENDFREQIKKWSENEDISIDLRQLLVATREKVKLYGYPALKSPKLVEEKYKAILQGSLPFLETHLDSILQEKYELQKSGLAEGKPKTIELAFTVFEESGEGLMKREIVIENIITILKKGLLVNANDLNTKVANAIDRVRSQTELIPLMNMVSELYPSLKSQKINPRPLFETLVEKMGIADNLFQRRIFLSTLLNGAKIFPTEASLNLNIVSADGYDVVTQNQIDSVMEKVEETY